MYTISEVCIEDYGDGHAEPDRTKTIGEVRNEVQSDMKAEVYCKVHCEIHKIVSCIASLHYAIPARKFPREQGSVRIRQNKRVIQGSGVSITQQL